MSLQGKTIFITGASRGIGLSIALKAAKDGANIANAAKTTEPHPKLEEQFSRLLRILKSWPERLCHFNVILDLRKVYLRQLRKPFPNLEA